MLTPRRTFTGHEADTGPVAHILSNVLYMYEYPTWYSPEEIHGWLRDAQYLWGTGVEMAFLASCGFMTRHIGLDNLQTAMKQKTPYLRSPASLRLRQAGGQSWTPELLEYRQQLLLRNIEYLETLGERAAYIPKKPTFRRITTALSQGMVVDLAWDGTETQAMAALAYGIKDGNRIQLYCPYETRPVLRSYDPVEFLQRWRASFGVNLYWYAP